jgi:hypothetical protein
MMRMILRMMLRMLKAMTFLKMKPRRGQAMEILNSNKAVRSLELSF